MDKISQDKSYALVIQIDNAYDDLILFKALNKSRKIQLHSLMGHGYWVIVNGLFFTKLYLKTWRSLETAIFYIEPNSDRIKLKVNK